MINTAVDIKNRYNIDNIEESTRVAAMAERAKFVKLIYAGVAGVISLLLGAVLGFWVPYLMYKSCGLCAWWIVHKYQTDPNAPVRVSGKNI